MNEAAAWTGDILTQIVTGSKKTNFSANENIQQKQLIQLSQPFKTGNFELKWKMGLTWPDFYWKSENYDCRYP